MYISFILLGRQMESIDFEREGKFLLKPAQGTEHLKMVTVVNFFNV